MLYSLYVLYTVRQLEKSFPKTSYYNYTIKFRTMYNSYSPIFTVHKFLNQHTTLKRIEVKFYEVYLSQHDTEDTI